MAPKRKSDALSEEDCENELLSQSLVAQETPPENVFVPPSIIASSLLSGGSYTHHAPIPRAIAADLSQPCVLGVDEAGRGPVLGPMVYGVAYLPAEQHRRLLADEYRFDDSKVLSPEVRSSLLRRWCTAGDRLHDAAGWAVRLLSARDIGAGMLRRHTYNLNQQAMDATVALIRAVVDSGVNVAEIYVDTIGNPAAYQRKLEPFFPHARITVAKKADSLYPCVSAASVAAKVTRDAALEVLWRGLHGSADVVVAEDASADVPAAAKTLASKKQKKSKKEAAPEHANLGWGSGYPSDARCSGWLKKSMHPLFGWGQECRLSWGTAKDMLEEKGGVKVVWPEPDDENAHMRISNFFAGKESSVSEEFTFDDADPLLDDKWTALSSWFGTPVAAPAS